MDLEQQSLDLRHCIETSYDLLATKAHEKGIDLMYQVESHTSPPLLYGDVTRLRQILVNLIGNALKFTEQGEVYVSVSVVSSAS